MKLNHIEKNSELFNKLKKYYEERLAKLRSENDQPKKPEADTELLRGRIAEVKIFLALANNDNEE